MKIKRFDQLNEDISSIFKPYTYKELVSRSLLDIIMREKEISEKDFSRIDNLIKNINDYFNNNDKIDTIIKEFEEKQSRSEYCAEFIYDNIIKNKKII